MTHFNSAPLAGTTHDVHMQLATEQSAMHGARLALARWTSGNTCIELQLEKVLRPTRQSRWHEQAQTNFITWLELGGFASDAMAEAAQQAVMQAARSSIPA